MVILCSGVVLLGKSLNLEYTYIDMYWLNTKIFERPKKFQVYPYFLIHKFHSCVCIGQAKIEAGKNF